MKIYLTSHSFYLKITGGGDLAAFLLDNPNHYDVPNSDDFGFSDGDLDAIISRKNFF